MAALVIAAASVAYVTGPIAGDVIAGEAFSAGDMISYAASGKWVKAQCDTNDIDAGKEGLAMALFSADANGARGSAALPGAVVTVGAGVAGTPYCVGAVAGDLVPVADLVSTNRAVVAALGIGGNQLMLTRVAHATAVVP